MSGQQMSGMFRCENGHTARFNEDAGEWWCPVPEHDPKRIVDIKTASLVWERSTSED